MDEKEAGVCMPAGEEVIVPIGIKYTGIPENRMSVTVVECISADGKAIPPVIYCERSNDYGVLVQ